MSFMPDWYERRFMLLELFWPAALSAALYVWMRNFGGGTTLDTWLQGNRGEIYGTLASILGTLLGFVITVVSLLLAVWSHDALKFLRDAGQSENIWMVMKSCMRWLGAGTLLALAALVFDRDGAVKPLLFCVTTGAVLVAVLRVTRTVWIFEAVISQLTKSQRLAS